MPTSRRIVAASLAVLGLAIATSAASTARSSHDLSAPRHSRTAYLAGEKRMVSEMDVRGGPGLALESLEAMPPSPTMVPVGEDVDPANAAVPTRPATTRARSRRAAGLVRDPGF